LFADGISSGFQFQSRRATPSETDRAQPPVGDQFKPVFGREMVNHLHRGGRQSGFAQRRVSFFRQQFCCSRMTRMRLGDDGISRRNRRRKIAAGHAVVCEGKIVRPEN
jgi:hypothetical protein